MGEIQALGAPAPGDHGKKSSLINDLCARTGKIGKAAIGLGVGTIVAGGAAVGFGIAMLIGAVVVTAATIITAVALPVLFVIAGVTLIATAVLIANQNKEPPAIQEEPAELPPAPVIPAHLQRKPLLYSHAPMVTKRAPLPREGQVAQCGDYPGASMVINGSALEASVAFTKIENNQNNSMLLKLLAPSFTRSLLKAFEKEHPELTLDTGYKPIRKITISGDGKVSYEATDYVQDKEGNYGLLVYTWNEGEETISALLIPTGEPVDLTPPLDIGDADIEFVDSSIVLEGLEIDNYVQGRPMISVSCNIPIEQAQLQAADYQGNLFSMITFGEGRKKSEEVELSTDQIIQKLCVLGEFEEKALTVLSPNFSKLLANRLIEHLKAQGHNFKLKEITPQSKKIIHDAFQDKMTRVNSLDIVTLTNESGEDIQYSLTYTCWENTGKVKVEFTPRERI